MAQTVQPSLKSRALVRNRNNISEMNLAKQIKDYDRERSMIILSLDHDRLDMKDFLKQIKKCESDELPESRHWLRQRRAKKQGQIELVKYISKTTSAVEKKSPAMEVAKPRDVHTAPDPDMASSGTFRINRSIQDNGKLSLYSIFSRRAELVDAGPTWQTSPDETEVDTGEQEGADKAADPEQDEEEAPKEDFMKDLLVVNAEKRYRKKAKPIEERLADYYHKLDEVKRRQAANEPSAWEIKRRYVLLTRGVKATLDLTENSDDKRLVTKVCSSSSPSRISR